jgi:hypothetical protein
MSARSRIALLLSLALALPALALAPGTASGTLTINGKTVKMTHAYAARKKDPFDKAKQVTYVLLADHEVPPAAVHDTGEMMMFESKNPMNYLEITFDDKKQVISTGVNSALLQKMSHISGVGRQKLDLTANDATHVAGRFYLEKPEEFFDNKYIYDVKFDAPFSAAPKEPGVEALKGTKLPPGGGDPGKAYMAYTKVLAAGDLKALRKALAAARAKDLDDPDFKKMFPLIQAMQAKNIKVTGGAIDGDTATLLATGKDGDATSNGTITMVREGGAWKVQKESWKTKSD